MLCSKSTCGQKKHHIFVELTIYNADFSVLAEVRGEPLSEGDLNALEQVLANRFNFSHERINISLVSSTKREMRNQNLRLDISGILILRIFLNWHLSFVIDAASTTSEEPTTEEIISDFLELLENKTKPVVVNEKEVEFTQIIVVPPKNTRPGEHLHRVPNITIKAPVVDSNNNNVINDDATPLAKSVGTSTHSSSTIIVLFFLILTCLLVLY